MSEETKEVWIVYDLEEERVIQESFDEENEDVIVQLKQML